MRTIPFLALLLMSVALPARAQFNRVFVSARSGHDVNSSSSCPGMTAPCCPQGNDITTPCQTFQGAVNQVAAGGAVIVLDTGGYGPVTIGKPLTIDVPTGVIAFIHPPSGSGVTINAGSTDVVVLRGLSVNTSTHTFAGIDFVAGGTLRVENCVIHGFSSGIRQQGAGLFLVVKDTTVRSCDFGINVVNKVLVERCRLKGNGSGLIANAGSNVTVRGSNVSGNVQGGLTLDSHQSGLSAQLNIEDCLMAHNGIGVESLVFGGALGLVRVSNSTITNNTTGLFANGGALLSRVNNTVEGNTTDTMGTITPYNPK